MSNKKQTATQFLEDEFLKLEQIIGVHYVMYELLEKAKEMEKQQIIDAYNEGRKKMNYINKSIYSPQEASKLETPFIDFEQYYNETYER